MAQAGPFPILKLTEGLLDRVVASLDLWDLAAARSSCHALRAAAGRRARRLCFSPLTLRCEHAYVQVGRGSLPHGRAPAARSVGKRGAMQHRDHPALPTCSANAIWPTQDRPAQKRTPTSFQLFPNAREIVLRPYEEAPPGNALRLDVPGAFRLPDAPAEAAAARAALAGVTRLEVLDGLFRPGQLAAALLHLPGLRAVMLKCQGSEEIGECGADALALNLVAALAMCPRLESLEWNLTGWPPTGASGSGWRPCRDERRPGGRAGGSVKEGQEGGDQPRSPAPAPHTTGCPTLAPPTLQVNTTCPYRCFLGASPPARCGR
jgi:hypothetical protein